MFCFGLLSIHKTPLPPPPPPTVVVKYSNYLVYFVESRHRLMLTSTLLFERNEKKGHVLTLRITNVAHVMRVCVEDDIKKQRKMETSLKKKYIFSFSVSLFLSC